MAHAADEDAEHHAALVLRGVHLVQHAVLEATGRRWPSGTTTGRLPWGCCSLLSGTAADLSAPSRRCRHCQKPCCPSAYCAPWERQSTAPTLGKGRHSFSWNAFCSAN